MQSLVRVLNLIAVKCSLIGFLLCLLVGCSSHKSHRNFKLQYNAIFNADAFLKLAEDDRVYPNILSSTSSLFGDPNPQNFSTLEIVIQRLQDLLPKAEEEQLKDELYFRLAKAYFLKKDYYTALAYLDLLEDSSAYNDLKFWKANALTRLQKTKEAYLVLNNISFNTLSTKRHTIFYANKADLFLKEPNIDSAIHYLNLALNSHPPKKYKYVWQLQLGKLNMDKDQDKAKSYLKKVAKSNFASDAQKIEASLLLSQVENDKIDNRLKAFSNLLKHGYTVGKEWIVDYTISKEYLNIAQLDSAEKYANKIITNESVLGAFKNQARWELGNAFAKHHKFQKAESYLVEMDKESLSLFDTRSRVLIENYETWLSLLEKEHIATESQSLKTHLSAKYELADFYRRLGLKDDALEIMHLLVNKTNGQHQDFVHDLNLLQSKSDTNIRFEELYKALYNDFENEKYTDVLLEADKALLENYFVKEQNAKIAYLKAFAIGRSNTIDSLTPEFEQLKTHYPKTIEYELVQKHLDFIQENKTDFMQRKIALEKNSTEFEHIAVQYETSKTEIQPVEIQAQNIGTFIEYRLPESEPYYYVIMIENPHVNLSPTRYGVGQFLRTLFSQSAYKHEYMLLEKKEQLITVGVFESLAKVRDFEAKIVSFLPEIIKVREKKYTTFVIPKLILDKSKDLELIYEYLEKYK